VHSEENDLRQKRNLIFEDGSCMSLPAGKVLEGALAPAALDILYEVGFEFADFPDIPTIGKGSGIFRLPNVDDCLIDLGVPGLSYALSGMSPFTIGALAYGIPMFFFNTWRMTAAEIKEAQQALKEKGLPVPSPPKINLLSRCHNRSLSPT
jgi:hypothetical protein